MKENSSDSDKSKQDIMDSISEQDDKEISQQKKALNLRVNPTKRIRKGKYIKIRKRKNSASPVNNDRNGLKRKGSPEKKLDENKKEDKIKSIDNRIRAQSLQSILN